VRAKNLVNRLLEVGPDDVDPRQYLKATRPWWNWDYLDDFTKAYVEAALWSTNDNSDESGGEPLDKNYSARDIAPETLMKMAEDCARFQQENAQDLAQYDMTNVDWSAAAQGGHDFWLTRNGHGVGFSDRDNLPEDARERLETDARQWSEFDLYVGDDKRIYH
jgi:hypothetical protein